MKQTPPPMTETEKRRRVAAVYARLLELAAEAEAREVQDNRRAQHD